MGSFAAAVHYAGLRRILSTWFGEVCSWPCLAGCSALPGSLFCKECTAVSSEAWAKLRDCASVAGRGRLLLSGSVAIDREDHLKNDLDQRSRSA